MEKLLEKKIRCMENERRVSGLEQLLIEMNQLEPSMLVFFHTCTLHSTQFIPEDIVRESFHELSKRHFLLRSRIPKDKDDNYIIQQMEMSKEAIGFN